jgi:very-short-patch-repair endonuclease
MRIHYNHHLKQKSRALRNNPTLAEKILWQEIRNRKIRGYQFSRQKPIDIYVVDFYCNKLNLVIEVDGASHGSREIEDKIRQERIERLGIKFLRFTDEEVINHMKEVLHSIIEWMELIETQQPPVVPF